ncbi:hypothetical protein CG716_11040 [Mycolicibacterium sphagni]|uniref:Phage head morphogenesis domain-containing protein n=1 Tax=Mycolicibacterium sphagni TaxID=1786 RepID=A0A255DRX2_9MYCO|nr:hypothetical protein CG716_11040 [Mycolicibacterium sphagni]
MVYAAVFRREQTREDGALAIAGLINRSNAEGVGLADVFVARQLEELSGQPVPSVGLLPVDDSERLLKAAHTVLDDPDPTSRLERLAGNEPLETAQQAVSEALVRQQRRIERRTGKYVGWVRQMNANACQRCVNWAQDGRVWPANYRMPTHKGCNCVERIVISEKRPKPVRQKGKQNERTD